MPNVVDQNGIQVASATEVLAALTVGMKAIYGPNINLLPNSPDGQFLALCTQIITDNNQLALQIGSSFDPDQAVGVLLDQRCAINGVFRDVGTFTITGVSVVTTQAVTLQGLDLSPAAPFTVADAGGNKYQLVTTTAIGGAGTQVLVFQAAVLGALTPIINTITNIVTITLGVASVNNPSAATTIGTDEESDAPLRQRRANSVALPSRGFFDGLYGALQDIIGVTSVNLLNNKTSATDANGVPAHSIWAIVNGGSNADIANVIFVKLNAGCGCKGGITVEVNQADGNTDTIAFDRPTAQVLYVSFNVAAISGTVDVAFLRAQILQNFNYQIGQEADATAIVAFVKALAPNASVTLEGVSPDGVTYTALLNPTGVNYQFGLTAATIFINGAHG